MLKKLLRFIFIPIFILLIFYLGVEIGFRTKYKIEQWKFDKAVKRLNQAFLDILRKDTYGGKTPEETYNLYLNALKNGDIELASRYYWWDKQEKEKQRLEKLKKEGKLEEYVNSLPDWSEMKEEEYWNPKGRRYSWIEILEEAVVIKLPLGGNRYQEELLEPGEYKQEIIFRLNTHANIWKLY